MIWGIFFLVLLIPLAAVVLDSQLGRALAARLERSTGRDAEGMNQRVATLESEIERLGAEVRRLQEESEFTHRLLTSRPAAEPLPPPDERSR